MKNWCHRCVIVNASLDPFGIPKMLHIIEFNINVNAPESKIGTPKNNLHVHNSLQWLSSNRENTENREWRIERRAGISRVISPVGGDYAAALRWRYSQMFFASHGENGSGTVKIVSQELKLHLFDLLALFLYAKYKLEKKEIWREIRLEGRPSAIERKFCWLP